MSSTFLILSPRLYLYQLINSTHDLNPYYNMNNSDILMYLVQACTLILALLIINDPDAWTAPV